MTVLVATGRLTASVARDAREACRALALEPVDWVLGVPRAVPVAVICGLDRGARRIPEDVLVLLEATPALRLVLCAQEPLIKPRVVIGDGRVCVLGPPIERGHIVAALRAVVARPPPPPTGAPHDRRFEVLRRSHWLAWARGRSGPAVSLHEQQGTTVVIGGPGHDPVATADAIAPDRSDADREAALAGLAGAVGVAHLTHDADAWVIYWPFDRCPLWICSPNRLPARWNAARAIAALGGHRGPKLVRLPAFPHDQLVAGWSEAASAHAALAPIEHAMLEGGSETILGLDDLVGRDDQLTGLVMEVR
jgi:hypothetical protein